MDLQNLFTGVINMTITGTIAILCVLPARLVLKKAPRILSWMLWLVVIFRLLCPVSVPGPVSVLEWVDAPRAESGAVEYFEPPVRTPMETVRAEIGSGEIVETIPVPSAPPIDWNLLGSRVWAVGVCALVAYGILSYVDLKRKLRESVSIGKGIREADGIASPFVLGRTIYLPAGLREEERDYILLHERLHLCHGDPIVKVLFWLAVCIHWFNPLVWLGFFLCGRDMELRCDEAVLKKLGPQVRSDYAQSLLDLAAGRQFAPTPLAFGEGDTGKRVRFVLSWKRGRAWMAVFGVVLCTAVLMLTACDPARDDNPFGHSYRVESSYTSDPRVSLAGNTYYTLTSDMGLYIRSDNTQLAGFFRKASAEAAHLKEFSRDLRRCWHIEDSGWWLRELKNGALVLDNLDKSVSYTLARTDLLGVFIHQPGMQSYLEPAWYRSDAWNWPIEELSSTLVDGCAKIILEPEIDVDMILVSEEYYELLRNGEYTITVSDHFLERDEKGDFSLDVSRRGQVGDDFAVYRVTVGDDNYSFRLAFPAAPGETSVCISVPEETREVRYEEKGAFISLRIPESWGYTVTYLNDDAYNAGITFWPRGREEGKIRLEYYPQGFGVCGTGLETATTELAGRTVTVGTYDGAALWDYISFGDDFAAWGEGHESWWPEYGEIAMEILDNAWFDHP